MNIKFTVYISNIKHGSSHLLTNDSINELDSIFVTSEKMRYIPITHSEAVKAAVKTAEEQEAPALYIPGYVQLTIDNNEIFTEDDWTTDILMTWKGFSLLLDREYFDSFSKKDEINITLLDNQTECMITNLGKDIQLKIARFLIPEIEDTTIDINTIENTIFESPLIPKEVFLNAIKEELENVFIFLQSNELFKEDSSYETILEIYDDISKK
ncbi:hypothetical protein NIZ91_10645 [Bacillus sp. 1780r2a1]|nr:hypothetical protein NIZ91_10645 [Bacillus sp. 1780r2a1]